MNITFYSRMSNQIFVDRFMDWFNQRHSCQHIMNILTTTPACDISWAIGLNNRPAMTAITYRKHPFIVTPLGTDLAVDTSRRLTGRFLRGLLLYADLVHVQDPLSVQRCLELGVKKDRICMIPWGVNRKLFKPMKTGKEWDVLNIYGNHPDVYGIGQLRQLNGFTVQFCEHIPFHEMPLMYNKSRCFVDCFTTTNLGHTYGFGVLEAMACGIPCCVAERPTINLSGDDQWYYGGTFKNGSNLGMCIRRAIDEKVGVQENLMSIKVRFDWHKNMRQLEESVEHLGK